VTSIDCSEHNYNLSKYRMLDVAVNSDKSLHNQSVSFAGEISQFAKRQNGGGVEARSMNTKPSKGSIFSCFIRCQCI